MQTKHSKISKLIAIFSLLILVNGCGTMKAATGNTVKVDYTGSANGKVFDTSIKEEAEKAGIYNEARSYEPLEFKVGAGQMIKGFDKAVEGMEPGEEKTVDITPEEAYGEYNPELVKEVPLEALKDNGITPQPGQRIELMTPQGPLRAALKEVTDNFLVLDFNHELAGKTLTFKIIMKEIK